MSDMNVNKIGERSFTRFSPIPTMLEREQANGIYGAQITNLGNVPKARTQYNSYGLDRSAPYFNAEWNNAGPEILHPTTTFSDAASDGIYEDDQDFGPGGPFAITINGTTDAEGVQTSPFTIDCNSGTGTYPANGTGTTLQVVNFSSQTGVSASPSISGVTSWRVYAKVGATITNNGIDVNANGTIEIVEVADTTDLVGSNTRYKATSSTTYDFYFLIGSVDAKRQTSGGRYNVKVTQIQNGNYSYGNVESTTATVGGSTVSTKDGLRRFTICINGEPFTCEIDVSNIQPVT
jgi:hypothetical protein